MPGPGATVTQRALESKAGEDMNTNKLLLVLTAASLAGGALLQSAAAQVLEEITVTATKRESGLQEIPMSISAITGESLERNGIADFTDIATSVPSVSFRSSGPGRTKLNVRGISAATGVAPTVSFYIDELPVQTISSGSTRPRYTRRMTPSWIRTLSGIVPEPSPRSRTYR